MTNEEKMLDILAAMRMEMATKKDLENEILKINIRLDTEIVPRLDALAEGHASILEQLTPRTRIDEMENEIRFLKSAMFRMSEDMERLKQAQ